MRPYTREDDRVILDGKRAGLSYGAIARELRRTRKSVSNHHKRILSPGATVTRRITVPRRWEREVLAAVRALVAALQERV